MPLFYSAARNPKPKARTSLCPIAMPLRLEITPEAQIPAAFSVYTEGRGAYLQSLSGQQQQRDSGILTRGHHRAQPPRHSCPCWGKGRGKRHPGPSQSMSGKQTTAVYVRGVCNLRPCPLRPPLSLGSSGSQQAPPATGSSTSALGCDKTTPRALLSACEKLAISPPSVGGIGSYSTSRY